MSSSDAIIGHANPHTIKKFELIEKYVEAWAHKLLQNQYCSGLVFIDCMSNSGEYVDDDGKQVFGTPVRVAKYLRNVAGQYPYKQIDLFFSDLCAARTDHLKGLMPNDSRNFHVHITTEDGNELAKRLGQTMSNKKHYLLVYDPYEATIDWNAIMPFINSWSEVILNHMVSDSMRAVKMVKKDEARSKYEQTYLMDLENLIPYGSDKKAYEKRIEDIIKALHRNSNYQYYIAAFPFFNEKNAIVYNLIHCTNNIKGFRLYKQSAWQTFGGKSSTKNTHGLENQLMLDFEGKGVGFDLKQEYVDLSNSRVSEPPANCHCRQMAFCDDARNIVNRVAQGTVKLAFTSPPYANILNRERKNKSRRGDLRENEQFGKVEQYSQDPRDLGILDADSFEKQISEIFRDMMPVFQEKAHILINITDAWIDGKRVPLHINIINAMRAAGYEFRNTIIWDRRNLVNKIGIFGWPSSYITMGTTFEYILDFTLPAPVKKTRAKAKEQNV